MTKEQQPKSPGTSAVELRDCMEDLLKYVLQFYIEGALEFDLGLPKDYCSYLLSHHVANSTSFCTDHGNGVPLYKPLASMLYDIMTSDDTYNQTLQLELSNLLKTVSFELHVQEPFFTQLKDGFKTVEGRCSVGDYQKIKEGDIILFNKCLVVEVKGVRHYASFHELLEEESLRTVLPGIDKIEEGVNVYRKFYTEEKERSNGVLAICVATPVSQPFKCLPELISRLSYEGIQNIIATKCQGGEGQE